MFHHLKNVITITALSLSFTQAAYANGCEQGDSLYPCGLEFTSIPLTPPLIADSGIVTSDPYVLTNFSANPVTLNSVILAIQPGDNIGPGSLAINSGSTCQATTVLASSGTCEILLDFDPEFAGDLDWNLIVTPQTQQRPLVVNVQASVIGPDLHAAYVIKDGLE